MTAEQINNLPEWILDMITWMALGHVGYWAFLIIGGLSLTGMVVEIWRSNHG